MEEIISRTTFAMLEGKVDSRIIKALASMGIVKPTQIQVRILPYFLLQNDIIGAAKTGSGKTLAFLIPVIDNLLKIGFAQTHGKLYFHHQNTNNNHLLE